MGVINFGNYLKRWPALQAGAQHIHSLRGLPPCELTTHSGLTALPQIEVQGRKQRSADSPGALFHVSVYWKIEQGEIVAEVSFDLVRIDGHPADYQPVGENDSWVKALAGKAIAPYNGWSDVAARAWEGDPPEFVARMSGAAFARVHYLPQMVKSAIMQSTLLVDCMVFDEFSGKARAEFAMQPNDLSVDLARQGSSSVAMRMWEDFVIAGFPRIDVQKPADTARPLYLVPTRHSAIIDAANWTMG